MSEINAIGVDLGGTNIRVALVSASGKIVKKIKEPSGGDVMATLKRAVDALEDRQTVGVGIGVAGLIDKAARRVLVSPNLPSVAGKGFDELGLGIPVVVENDASAAAWGEKWMGAGMEMESFVLLTLGTGIGCGVIHKGRLLDAATEAGHMSIHADGEKCECGNYGCLEQYAGGRAITDAATKALESGTKSMLRECCKGSYYKVTPEDIFNAALEGDNLARDILKDAGRHLGVGIANMVNLLSPEAVVLSGGLTGAWDIYVLEAINEASKRSFKGLMQKVRVMPSSLGTDDAGVIGAAGLVLNEK